MEVRIRRESLDDIHAHAREAYPHECCGMIVERSGREEVVRVSNVQDEMHEKDPERFPRSAKTAYTMGPESVPVLTAADRGELRLRAFYHSHPEHDAYFSEEDRRQACPWGEPSFPDAAQIVVSVYDRAVKNTAAFAWDEKAGDFLAAELAAG